MQKNIKLSIIAVIAFAIIAVGGYFAVQNSKEYVDGNVFNLNISGSMEQGIVPIPWRNNIIVANLLYRSLFQPDHTQLEVKPDLASYELKEDGLTYVIKLTEGNKWSDNEPITMKDVVWSIETVQKIVRPHYLYTNAFEKIESMEEDGNTLTIKLSEKSTIFIRVLAQLVILPEHKLGDIDPELLATVPEYWRNPVTSGMYSFNEYVDNKYISFVRNPNYSKKKPQIEEVRLHMNVDNVKLDYHYTTNNIQELMNFRAMRGYSEYVVDMNFFRYLVFNVNGADGNRNEALEDVRVRQAICMALNREGLLHDIYLGMGNIVDGAGVIGELGPYNYNPEKAKELLAKSGYDLSRPLRFTYYYGDATSFEFLQQAAKQLEAVGFKVILERASSPDYLYGIRPYDIMLKGIGAFQPSEWFEEYASTHAFLTSLNGGKGELDELIFEIRGESNKLEHDVLLNELARQELELLYKFPLFTLNQTIYINTDRMNIPTSFKPGNYFYIYDMKFEDWSIKKQ